MSERWHATYRALAFSRLVAHFCPLSVPQSVRFRVAPCCQTGNNAAPASSVQAFSDRDLPLLFAREPAPCLASHRLFRYWACLLLAAIAAPAVAENEGQDDLDKATQLKVTAETLDDLNEVVDQAESAIGKGPRQGQQEVRRSNC